ncbi:MAG: FkbM family methyltransferase [Parasphingopyxis sp.]
MGRAEQLGDDVPEHLRLGQRTPLWGLSKLQQLKGVDTVFDIGVFKGTPELYAAFEQSHFVLVDPIRNAPDRLKIKPARYTYVNRALGAEPGMLTLDEMGPKTGLQQRTPLAEGKLRNQYEVEVVTLDTVIDEHAPEGTIGLKIDTEGFEEEVIKGLVRHSDRVTFAICEASIRRRFVGGYRFSDLIIAMRERGLEFFNILNQTQAFPRCYDLLFLRHDHPMFD